MKRFLFLTFLLWTASNVLNAQGTITGQVLDAANQETLPGATVLIEGTNNGTTSDYEGRFTLRRHLG